MPDYDPKDVPTLDDIIKNDITDNAKTAIDDGVVEPDDAVIKAAEYDINQFLAESIDQDTDSTVSDETGPQAGDLDEDKNDAPIIDAQPVEPAPQVSVEPISVELIVNDIVKQLMPELEQQLTHLLQQALEDKLPEEIRKDTDTENQN